MNFYFRISSGLGIRRSSQYRHYLPLPLSLSLPYLSNCYCRYKHSCHCRKFLLMTILYSQIGNASPDISDFFLLERKRYQLPKISSTNGVLILIMNRSSGDFITTLLQIVFARNCSNRYNKTFVQLFNEEVEFIIEVT